MTENKIQNKVQSNLQYTIKYIQMYNRKKGKVRILPIQVVLNCQVIPGQTPYKRNGLS
jgi:hypothetical protein